MFKFLKTKKGLLVLFILIAIVVSVWKYNSSKSSTNVKTANIERGTVREELVLSGEIKAREQANLNFLTSGELDYVGVKEGDFVKKDQVLAKLDSTNAYQTFLSAEADLRRYQASLNNTYDQVQGHAKDESFTQIETRTVAETNKDKAYRNYVIAQKNLTSLSLKAPFDGVVSSITHPFNGINTSLTESQIEIVNPDTLYLDVVADQTEVIKLHKDQKVLVILDSFPDNEIEGTVSYIGYTPKVGEVGTVYKVTVDLTKGLSEEMKVGMSGDAKFVLSERQEVLYLSPIFINTDTTGKFVYVDNKKTKKYVEVGIEGEDKVEIKGDIKEGDTVYD